MRVSATPASACHAVVISLRWLIPARRLLQPCWGAVKARPTRRVAEGCTRGLDRRVSGFADPSRAWRTPACFSLCGHWRAVEPRLQKAGCARRRAPVCAIRFHVLKADCVCAAPSPPSSRCVLAGVFGKHAASRGPSESLLIWLATAHAPGSCVYFSRAQAGQDTGGPRPKARQSLWLEPQLLFCQFKTWGLFHLAFLPRSPALACTLGCCGWRNTRNSKSLIHLEGCREAELSRGLVNSAG